MPNFDTDTASDYPSAPPRSNPEDARRWDEIMGRLREAGIAGDDIKFVIKSEAMSAWETADWTWNNKMIEHLSN